MISLFPNLLPTYQGFLAYFVDFFLRCVLSYDRFWRELVKCTLE